MDLEYGPEYQEFTKKVQSFCKKYEGQKNKKCTTTFRHKKNARWSPLVLQA